MGAIKSPVHPVRAAIVAEHQKGRVAVTKEDIVARASSMAFGKPLIMNVLKSDDRGNYNQLRFILGLEVVLHRLRRMGF